MELQCNVLVDGRRKPLCTDVVIAAHANVRTTIISLYTFENFLRFQLQDKHNASYFSNMSWRGMPPQKKSKCKSNKKAEIITCLVVDLFQEYYSAELYIHIIFAFAVDGNIVGKEHSAISVEI